MENCTPRCKASKLLIFGIILILVRLYYPAWDIWVVLGTLLIIKAILLFIMPICRCNVGDNKIKKKK